MPERALTPMMRQYYRIKDKYRDSILLFRVGDFYETFGEDAKIASRELNIALTTAGGGKGRGRSTIPMAGVPFHAATPYIRQLIKKGYRVAICEQIEGGQGQGQGQGHGSTAGIERREVVRLITPGTVIEDTLLDERASNYLMCVSCMGGKVGIAIIDISTGEFSVTELEHEVEALANEIERVRPAEIVIPESMDWNIEVASSCAISRYDDYYFDYKNAYTALINHFGVISLDGFGCGGLRAGISAAGAVISYLRDTQKRILGHIKPLKTFFISDYMVLDGVTVRNLEIFANIRDGTQRGTLISVLDKTLTGMGSRMLKKSLRYPLLDVEEIRSRQEVVKEFFNDILLREALKDALSNIYDIERIISRVAYGSARGRDLILLKCSLEQMNTIRTLLRQCHAPRLRAMYRSLKAMDFSSIVELIERGIVEEPPATLKDGGVIKDGFNAELDDLRRIKSEGRQWLVDFEAREKARTGIKSLKVGYNRVFGYYIEVRRAWVEKVPPYYIRKQTLTEAERYITEELKEYEAKALSAEERIKELEYELFEQIRERVSARSKDIQEAANLIAELDMLLALAEVAALHNYSCPEVVEGLELEIKEGRHPVVEREVKEGFVPNDVHFCVEREGATRLMIITGPNMSGKSTFMRQTALIVLMAQIGSFVPAREARIGVVDRIFTRVGAYDDLSMGQSSFMVEMSETANILNNATERSLVILDEIGRGTSTLDGVSIAWAVGEYMHDVIRAKTMFATHFHELTALADRLSGAKCYNVAIKESGDEIYFIRRVEEGRGTRSYGIQAAKLAGLPEVVIETAKRVQKQMELELGLHSHDTVTGTGTRTEAESGAESGGAGQPDPVIEELKQLDIDRMSPLEALNMLYELKKAVLKRS